MLALVVSVPPAEVELASDVLWSFGIAAVEERVVDDRVELWTSLGDDRRAVAEALSEHLVPWPWRFVEVDESIADTWRTHARPMWIDVGLVVCPAWVPLTVGADVTVVRIEPGSTFGLGDHPTTVLSLRAIRAAGVDGAAVLDVGCGSGVLAVTACVLGAAHATAVDVSPAAVSTTRANAIANGVAERVDVSTTPLAAIDEQFDVVVANILAPTLIDLAPDLLRVVAPNGVLIVSGVLVGRHEHVDAALRPLRTTHRADLDGWASVTMAYDCSSGDTSSRSSAGR